MAARALHAEDEVPALPEAARLLSAAHGVPTLRTPDLRTKRQTAQILTRHRDLRCRGRGGSWHSCRPWSAADHRSLDYGPAPPLRAQVPSVSGEGARLQASGLIFKTDFCWRVPGEGVVPG